MAIISEEDYALLDVPSYSVLSKIKHHPSDIDKQIKNEGIDIGSYLDTRLFSPSEVEKRFAFIDNNLGEKPQKIAEMLVNAEEITDDLIVNTAALVEYQSNYKRDTLLKKLKDELRITDYVDLLKSSKGKTIFDAEAKFKAETAYSSLKSDPFLSDIFNKTSKDTIYLHQVPCTAVVEGVVVKSKLDIVAIKFSREYLYFIPEDLKYSSRLTTFEDDILQYGYYLQAELYREVISQNFDALIKYAYNKIVTSDSMFSYNSTENAFAEMVREARLDVNPVDESRCLLEPFSFIVANEKYSPMKIRYNHTHQALHDFHFQGKKYRNVISLLSDYTYYRTINKFTHPREIFLLGYKNVTL